MKLKPDPTHGDWQVSCEPWPIKHLNNRMWMCNNKPDGIKGYGVNPTDAFHDAMEKTLRAEGASPERIRHLLATEYKNG